MGYPGRVDSKKILGRVTGQPIFDSSQKNRGRVRYFSSLVGSDQKILTRITISTVFGVYRN